jgi:hypothetical protein
MKAKEETIVIPELEELPDAKPRNWNERETEILWKYRKKDLDRVAKTLGRTRDACEAKLKNLRRERDEA